ncbi:KH domain-containing protein [Alicyclobacillus fructus]|uniref:KH domain-containing protein n=1 Tax=Alicyclobacillus fructus TaxID=2816082 RepID=UPI001A8FC04D|nr:KH domain-containing protein [Alicyclobacillus fructus]
MQDLVEFLFRSLVTRPDDVRVEARQEGDLTTYRVTVHPDDVGRVIGRQGRIANAVRSVVGAAAHRQGRRVHVLIGGSEESSFKEDAGRSQ